MGSLGYSRTGSGYAIDNDSRCVFSESRCAFSDLEREKERVSLDSTLKT
jgi:hypothetical protein